MSSEEAVETEKVIEGKFDKVAVAPRLRLVKLQILPVFHLVDAEGDVMDEVQAQAISMYPGKYLEFKALCAKLELDANAKRDEVEKIAARPLW